MEMPAVSSQALLLFGCPSRSGHVRKTTIDHAARLRDRHRRAQFGQQRHQVLCEVVAVERDDQVRVFARMERRGLAGRAIPVGVSSRICARTLAGVSIAGATQLQVWFPAMHAIHYQCHFLSMIITRILLNHGEGE